MRRWPAVLALVAVWLLSAASALAATPEPGLVSRVLPVLLSPDLRITDVFGKTISQIPVTPGETVMFAVSNIAGFENNFYIGPADRLKENQVAGLPGLLLAFLLWRTVREPPRTSSVDRGTTAAPPMLACLRNSLRLFFIAASSSWGREKCERTPAP